MTDPARMEVVLEDPHILIHEKKISSLHDRLPALERVAQSGQPLQVIAEDVEGDALGDARREQTARHWRARNRASR